MAAVVSNDQDGGQRPWAEVWPDCSPEDATAQLRTRHRLGQVGLHIEEST